jgi:hypothetical protein
MVLKHKGMISVDNKKLITSGSSTLTSAPITPRLVNRKYSNGLVLLAVFRNGYRKRGICAFKNNVLVSPWDATHCSNANALQTLLDACAVKDGGCNIGYIDTISCSKADMVPKLCHKHGANSGKDSRSLLSFSNAVSFIDGFVRSNTNCSYNSSR